MIIFGFQNLKRVKCINTSKFAKTTDLGNLKSIVVRLDIGKLETTPVGFGKRSNLVKNYVIKKSGYDELFKI